MWVGIRSFVGFSACGSNATMYPGYRPSRFYTLPELIKSCENSLLLINVADQASIALCSDMRLALG